MNLDHTYEAGSLKLISWKVSSVIPATLAFLFPLRFGYETSNLRTLQCAMKAMLMIIWCLEHLKTWANFEQDFHVRKMEVESWINSSTFFLIHKWKIQKDAEQFTPNINCSPKNYLCFGFEFYKQWCIWACKKEKIVLVQYKDRQPLRVHCS